MAVTSDRRSHIQFDLAYAKRFGEGPAERVSTTPSPHDDLQTVLACNCASQHKGRPEKTLGCGAYSGVKIELERRQWRWSPWPSWKAPEKPKVQLSTLRARSTEKRWDDAAGEAEEGMLARTQDVGTKWAATVATILALSGVAILLEAHDEIAELENPVWANAGAVAGLVLALIATRSVACAAQGLQGGCRS